MAHCKKPKAEYDILNHINFNGDIAKGTCVLTT
jgi:hypothetical protein